MTPRMVGRGSVSLRTWVGVPTPVVVPAPWGVLACLLAGSVRTERNLLDPKPCTRAVQRGQRAAERPERRQARQH